MRLLRCIVLLTLALSAAGAAAIDAAEMFSDPVKEARARELGKQLRCLVCQNQSIFDSNAGLARDLRDVVRERIEAGDSDKEIIAYINARFGDFVLLKPPVRETTIVLWATPPLLLLLVLLVAWRYLRRPRSASLDVDDAETARGRELLKGIRR